MKKIKPRNVLVILKFDINMLEEEEEEEMRKTNYFYPLSKIIFSQIKAIFIQTNQNHWKQKKNCKDDHDAQQQKKIAHCFKKITFIIM